MTGPMSDNGIGPPLLVAAGLRKVFGATRALGGVDLTLRAGEVHALVGQNGSGKSTLIKILCGYHAPDAGRLTVRGHEVRLPLHAGEAVAHGIAFLHQEAPVAAAMTVLENVSVGYASGAYLRPISRRGEQATVRRILESVGLDVDCNELAGHLPQAERALVGFAAAVQKLPDAGGILVLDEPTACLPPAGAERLFSAIRRLTQRGIAVLFVSHRLDEVLSISDRITVLREGCVVARLATAETQQDEIVELMIGREISALYPEQVNTARSSVLEADHLTGRIVTDLTFQLRQGEILGVTGLVGMGQDELPYLLYGSLPVRAGHITLGTRRLARVRPRDARAASMALLPADRARASGVLAATVTENLTLPILRRFSRAGWLSHRAESVSAHGTLHDYDVRPPIGTYQLGALSGGNQQKVLLAKWLQSDPQVLLLHEPTQGVDIGARTQIFEIIQRAAAGGTAVLIASSEYDDLAHLCNRVIVLNRGSMTATLQAEPLTERAIVRACLATP